MRKGEGDRFQLTQSEGDLIHIAYNVTGGVAFAASSDCSDDRAVTAETVLPSYSFAASSLHQSHSNAVIDPTSELAIGVLFMQVGVANGHLIENTKNIHENKKWGLN